MVSLSSDSGQGVVLAGVYIIAMLLFLNPQVLFFLNFVAVKSKSHTKRLLL